MSKEILILFAFVSAGCFLGMFNACLLFLCSIWEQSAKDKSKDKEKTVKDDVEKSDGNYYL